MSAQSAQSLLKMPTWLILWLTIGNIIVLWDALYVLFRPLSMAGGIYETIWIPYQKYIMHDKRYGDLNDPFVVAQSIVNLVELVLGVYAVVLHMNPRTRPSAMIFALVASVMTWSKTVIYFTIEYCGDMNYTGHNTPFDFMAFFFLPSFVWIVMPMLATFTISSRLTGAAQMALNNKTK